MNWNEHVEAFVKEMQSILGQRGEDYGSRQTNFDDIARGWGVLLGTPVTARQVALCMIWVKLAREIAGPKHDSMIDAANYALIADMLVSPDTED